MTTTAPTALIAQETHILGSRVIVQTGVDETVVGMVTDQNETRIEVKDTSGDRDPYQWYEKTAVIYIQGVGDVAITKA